MGKLIATTQATVDGVIDPVGEWVQADGDHGDYSFERQARSSGLVLGRKTYEGLAGYWPSASGRWADMVNPMRKHVGSNILSGDLEWNATVLEGVLEDSIPKLKDEVDALFIRPPLWRWGMSLACTAAITGMLFYVDSGPVAPDEGVNIGAGVLVLWLVVSVALLAVGVAREVVAFTVREFRAERQGKGAGRR
jgi:hypothetical protein